jgi:cytochrome c553
MKTCNTCKQEFPKTTEYFFNKVIKQKLSSGEIAVYNCLRSDCKKCHGKKGMKRKIKKRCVELKCNISEYRENWKKQYSNTRTKHNILKNMPIMTYHSINVTDIYVANTLKKKISELPKEVIETTRLIIKLKRITNGK